MTKAIVAVSPAAKPWDVDFSDDPGLTKQEFAKDCDVNEILRRCLRLGVPLPGPDVQAVFADVSEVGDYSVAVQRIRAAEEAFDGLSADVRARFRNDPVRLVEFVQNDENYDEAVKLGLVAPKALVPPEGAVPPKEVVPAKPAVTA